MHLEQTPHPSCGGVEMQSLHLNATSASSCLSGQSKPPYFITPEGEVEQIWIHFKMLWLSLNSDWDELLFLGDTVSRRNYPKKKVSLRVWCLVVGCFFLNNIIKHCVEI